MIKAKDNKMLEKIVLTELEGDSWSTTAERLQNGISVVKQIFEFVLKSKV